MKTVFAFLLALAPLWAGAQIPEAIMAPGIETVQLFVYGNQLAYPVLRLNTDDRLELHFDDLSGGVRNYSYTYQLCDADWKPAMLSEFDYLRGYSQIRITNYRSSSIAFTRYTHYQAILPDPNCVPTRSGNYILKVFKNGDTSQLLFTRRMLVLDNKSAISASVQQPFNGQLFRTSQKVDFNLSVNQSLQVVNPLQQLKVVILQNNRWDNAVHDIRPSFYSSNNFQYNTESDCVFPAGKEWRWVDLRSFRFQSDRIESASYTNKATDIILKPDAERSGLQINFYRDADGGFSIQTTENINPLWEADYATVHFRFVPANHSPFPDQEVYIYGALTDYALNDKTRMRYNAEEGIYEGSLFLKQGYYDYAYVTVDRKAKDPVPSFQFTEGNFWETENNYTILVYYRDLGGRADQLIGYAVVNSLTGRRGIGN